jgi:hypothetical protein
MTINVARPHIPDRKNLQSYLDTVLHFYPANFATKQTMVNYQTKYILYESEFWSYKSQKAGVLAL